MNPASPDGPRRLAAWFLALRPRTLPAGLVPVAVGSTLAAGSWTLPHPGRAAVAAMCALLIQIATNFYNDYADFVRGADTGARLGPRRATQQGWLPPQRVRQAALATFAVAALLGLSLVAIGGWPILAIGAASLAMGLAYTGGPYPLAYHGLGELFVFLFFGLVAVGGSAYLQTLRWPSPLVWTLASSVGLLASAILVVNNLRDRHTDARVHKRTLAVIFGAGPVRALYVGMLALAFLLPLAALCRGADRGLWALALSLPWALRAALGVWRADGAQLNLWLGRTAQLELLFGALLVLGVGK